jgi:phosphoglucomutase
VTSDVSSDLPMVIAKKVGVATIVVHTGFKWIADKIAEFERDHDHQHNFIFGFEESYGYLIKPFVRDKDATQATLLMSEIILYYQLQNKTILDRLAELYQEFGHYQNETISVDFPGEAGQEEMLEIVDKIRRTPPKSIGDADVDHVDDYLNKQPTTNLIKIYLKDNSWVAIRPSGTEPKLKLYISTVNSNITNMKENVIKLLK